MAYSKLPVIWTLTYSKFSVIRSQAASPLTKFTYSTQAKTPSVIQISIPLGTSNNREFTVLIYGLKYVTRILILCKHLLVLTLGWRPTSESVQLTASRKFQKSHTVSTVRFMSNKIVTLVCADLKFSPNTMFSLYLPLFFNLIWWYDYVFFYIQASEISSAVFERSCESGILLEWWECLCVLYCKGCYFVLVTFS